MVGGIKLPKNPVPQLPEPPAGAGVGINLSVGSDVIARAAGKEFL
jgi:hypothetical protein